MPILRKTPNISCKVMEHIHVDKIIENDIIQKTISKIFPDLDVFHFDFEDEKPDALDYENPKHIIFNTQFSPDTLEFGFTIGIYRTPDNYSTERALYIGKLFSEYNKVRVLVPFRKLDEPHDPYYDIIFDNGKTYLADDSDTSFGDGTKGFVKIIGEYSLTNLQFDNKAQSILT